MKKLRQNTILELVRAGKIASQDDLMRELRAQNIRVSQATLSRDIQELGLAKSGGVYAAVDQTVSKASGESLRHIFGEFLLDIDVAGNILVLKTGPGNAATVAHALDDASWPEVLGTLAGDDTIFAALRSASHGRKLVRRIRKLLKSQ